MIRRLLPTVLVGEFPTGRLDGLVGLRLAELDPANEVDGRGAATEPARTRRCIERTASLFHVHPLVVVDPEEPEWENPTRSPALVGRRIVLVGQAARDAAFLRLPVLRWLHLGEENEVREVCYLPHPFEQWTWYNDQNRAKVRCWLAEERRRTEAIASASLGLGDSLAYDPIHGAFIDVGDLRDDLVDRSRRALVEHAGGQTRWRGAPGALTGLEHALVVGRLAARWGGPSAGRGGMVHDLHEWASTDMPSPLKRVMRVCGDVWDEIDEVAQGAVARLFGVELSAEDREVVRLADLCSLAAEARRLGQVLVGSSARVRALPEEWVVEAEREIAAVVGAIASRMFGCDALDLERDATVDVWWREWAALGGQR